MKEIIFMVEEASMKEALTLILPDLIPESIQARIIKHQGKSDLEASIPRKLRAWANPNARFIVLRDNDGGDCRALKAKLKGICEDQGQREALIRIVCQELESWFLGDLKAVELSGLSADRNISAKVGKEKFRDPDALGNAKQELVQLAPRYRPLSGSRAIARHMDQTRNRSNSFNIFLSGVRTVITQLEG